MRKLIAAAIIACLSLALCIPAALAGTMEDLAGKWSLSRTNNDGQVVTQSLEIKQGKFTFRILNEEKKVTIFARGDVKEGSINSIHIISFTHIEGGASEDELKPLNDDRQCVYVQENDTLTLAVDFDKDRGKEPRVEVYSRIKS